MSELLSLGLIPSISETIKLGFRGGRKTAILFLFGQHVLHSGTQQLYTIFVKIKKIIFQEWQKHWIFKQIIFRTSKRAQNRRNSKSLSFPHFPSSKFLNQLAATPSLELAMRSSSSLRERVPPWLLLVYFMLCLWRISTGRRHHPLYYSDFDSFFCGSAFAIVQNWQHCFQ